MIRSSLYDYFAKLTDPRLNRNKKHNLSDIIVLSILAVIYGAESWDSSLTLGMTGFHRVIRVVVESRPWRASTTTPPPNKMNCHSDQA